MPGRHEQDTDPAGGDFVVMVDDEEMGWVLHQFTHDDLFFDIERKVLASRTTAEKLLSAYAKIVVHGVSPGTFNFKQIKSWTGTLHPQTFLYAVQCLSICEYRRHGHHERRGGGRKLPLRFSSGIVEGLWTAQEASGVQRRGRVGLDNLMKTNGKPMHIKDWADAA